MQRMTFAKMVKFLQEVNKGKIVWISCGAFYIAIGRDAVLLYKELGLKVNCMEKRICKVGVPIASIDKYLEKLDKLKYGYIVYEYQKDNNELIEKKKKEGKRNLEEEENRNCLLCQRGEMEELDGGYEEALRRLYE